MLSVTACRKKHSVKRCTMVFLDTDAVCASTSCARSVSVCKNGVSKVDSDNVLSRVACVPSVDDSCDRQAVPSLSSIAETTEGRFKLPRVRSLGLNFATESVCWLLSYAHDLTMSSAEVRREKCTTLRLCLRPRSKGRRWVGAVCEHTWVRRWR